MTDLELKAWILYCEDTAGSLHIADFWHELSPEVQSLYLEKVIGRK